MSKRCLKSVLVASLGITLCYGLPVVYSSPNSNIMRSAMLQDLPLVGISFVVFVLLAYNNIFSNKEK